jgi:cytochrome c-type biogenesis protein CcsB
LGGLSQLQDKRGGLFMALAEVIFFWATVFTYVAAFCFHLFGFVSEKKSLVSIGIRILWAGLLFNTITCIIRWVAGGHAPVTGTYELNLTCSWFVILLFLAFERAKKVESFIAIVVIPIIFLVLGNGFLQKTEAMPMGPAFQSLWLIVHVIFAWLAFGCYAMATGAALFLLLKQGGVKWKALDKTPEPEKLDVSSYRFIVIGFITHAVMLVSGAIWAKKLWGNYWSWNALDTWSLISFLIYAFILHVRVFRGWKMQRAAWLTMLGIVALAISYWGVELFGPTLHPGP